MPECFSFYFHPLKPKSCIIRNLFIYFLISLLCFSKTAERHTQQQRVFMNFNIPVLVISLADAAEQTSTDFNCIMLC